MRNCCTKRIENWSLSPVNSIHLKGGPAAFHRNQLHVLAARQTVSEVMQRIRSAPVLKISVRTDRERAIQCIEAEAMVDRIETDAEGRLTVHLKQGIEDYAPLAKVLIDGGFAIEHFAEDEMNLETAFMLLTQGISA